MRLVRVIESISKVVKVPIVTVWDQTLSDFAVRLYLIYQCYPEGEVVTDELIRRRLGFKTTKKIGKARKELEKAGLVYTHGDNRNNLGLYVGNVNKSGKEICKEWLGK